MLELLDWLVDELLDWLVDELLDWLVDEPQPTKADEATSPTASRTTTFKTRMNPPSAMPPPIRDDSGIVPRNQWLRHWRWRELRLHRHPLKVP